MDAHRVRLDEIHPLFTGADRLLVREDNRSMSAGWQETNERIEGSPVELMDGFAASRRGTTIRRIRRDPVDGAWAPWRGTRIRRDQVRIGGEVPQRLAGAADHPERAIGPEGTQAEQ